MPLLLGRKPARHTRKMMLSALITQRLLDSLGDPPAVCNDYITAVSQPWGMMLNDRLGCCVCADTGHMLMLRSANADGSIIVPTDDDVEALYEVVGGYKPNDPSTDQGCDETTMCEYLESTGFLGHKADATATVNPQELDHVKWITQLAGGCRTGISLPQSAMDQFNAGQPWDDIGDTNIIGGHDVPIVHYDANLFYVVTWGKLQAVTPRFLSNPNYFEEAHSELFFDWINQQGVAPSGFDLADLATKLGSLT